jgi:UDP-N-acetylglucosamine 4-epimerase
MADGASSRNPALAAAEAALREKPRSWLVTGSAGFIGSHLLEALLRLGQRVVSIDNFSTGYRRNLEEVKRAVGPEAWARHVFHEADIVDLDACRRACTGIDVVLHEAALGSVPRSIADPLATHAANATGFLNMMVAALDSKVQRFVYAASSSTYGDHPQLPKVEDVIGRPLSPYAVSKLVDELYADVFGRCYGLSTIGLRYFNVFGRRQDPNGAYAAVIPCWIDAMLAGSPVHINGDGSTTRDFCHVSNVVQANLLAATATAAQAQGQVYNVALGGRTSLLELHDTLRDLIGERHPGLARAEPSYRPFRPGDVLHSQADIGKARRLLGFDPAVNVGAGLREALPWYEDQRKIARRESTRAADTRDVA